MRAEPLTILISYAVSIRTTALIRIVEVRRIIPVSATTGLSLWMERVWRDSPWIPVPHLKLQTNDKRRILVPPGLVEAIAFKNETCLCYKVENPSWMVFYPVSLHKGEVAFHTCSKNTSSMCWTVDVELYDDPFSRWWTYTFTENVVSRLVDRLVLYSSSYS